MNRLLCICLFFVSLGIFIWSIIPAFYHGGHTSPRVDAPTEIHVIRPSIKQAALNTGKVVFDIPSDTGSVTSRKFSGSTEIFQREFSQNDAFTDAYLDAYERLVPYRFAEFLRARGATPAQADSFIKAMTNWRAKICDFQSATKIGPDRIPSDSQNQAENQFLAERNIDIDNALGPGASRELSIFRETSNERRIAMEVAKDSILSNEVLSLQQTSVIVDALVANKIELRAVGGRVTIPSDEQYFAALSSLNGVLSHEQVRSLARVLMERKQRAIPVVNKVP